MQNDGNKSLYIAYEFNKIGKNIWQKFRIMADSTLLMHSFMQKKKITVKNVRNFIGRSTKNFFGWILKMKSYLEVPSKRNVTIVVSDLQSAKILTCIFEFNLNSLNSVSNFCSNKTNKLS